MLSPDLKNLLKRQSVPVIVVFSEDTPTRPGPEETPAIEGIVRTISSVAVVTPPPTALLPAASDADRNNLKWFGPSTTA